MNILIRVVMANNDRRFGTVKHLAVIYGIVAIGVFFLGYRYLSYRANESFSRVKEGLVTVAELKSAEIERWCNERISDARVFAGSPNIIGCVSVVTSNESGRDELAKACDVLMVRMKTVKELYRYQNIFITDTLGRMLWGVKATTCRSPYLEMKNERLNGLTNQLGVMELFRCSNGDVFLDFVVPFYRGSKVLCYLVMRVDPYDFLYPMLRVWPMAGKTAETVIVRRDGNDVLFLSPVNHVDPSPLQLKIPLTNKHISGVKAVLGKRGIDEGVDYRGIKVMAYWKAVKGTPWLLGCKIDWEEVNRPVLREMLISAIVLLFLILLPVVVFVVLRSAARRKELQSMLDKEVALRSVLDQMMEGCQIIGRDWRYVYVNESAARDGHRTPGQLLGKSIKDCYQGIEKTPLWRELEHCMVNREARRYVNRFVFPDGEVGWFDLSIQPVPDGIFVLSLDITDRVRAEERQKASEQTLKLFVEHAPAAIAMFDNNMRYLAFSRRYVEDYRIGEAEIVGRSHYDIFPDLPPHWKDVHQRCLAGAIEKADEDMFLRSDGTVDWIKWELHPWRDGWGNVGGILLFSEVVTKSKLAAEQIKTNNLQLKRAQQMAHLGNWEKNLITGELVWSDEMYQILGIAHGSATSEEIQDGIMPHDEYLRLRQAIRECVDNDVSYSMDYRLVAPSGNVLYLHDEGEVIRDESGKALRLFGTMQDVTERKRSEQAIAESEYKLRRFYESGLVGVVFWTSDGGVTDANDKFLEMLGYDRDDLAKGYINWGAMTPEEYREQDVIALDELVALGVNVNPYEKEYCRKDGQRIPVLFAAATLDDTRTHGIAFVLDISDRKRAEDELVQLNLELEKRVEERTQQLVGLNTDLDAFAYSISHDLRAPLRGIKGFAEILSEDYKDILDDEGVRLCRIINENADKMSHLISDLLTFARTGKGDMKLVHVDMDPLVKLVLSEFGAGHVTNAVEFVVEPLEPSFVNPATIKQVWTNLVSNAVKYSSGREKPIVRIYSNKTDDEVVYTVADNGVGFDMDYSHKLFGVFQRLHDQQLFEGTGVGLAITRRIVEKHGGRIWAEGKVGVGASFHFSIPKQGSVS